MDKVKIAKELVKIARQLIAFPTRHPFPVPGKKKVSVIDIDWEGEYPDPEGLPSSADVVVNVDSTDEKSLKEAVTKVLEDNYDGTVLDFKALDKEDVPDDYQPTGFEIC